MGQANDSRFTAFIGQQRLSTGPLAEALRKERIRAEPLKAQAQLELL